MPKFAAERKPKVALSTIALDIQVQSPSMNCEVEAETMLPGLIHLQALLSNDFTVQRHVMQSQS